MLQGEIRVFECSDLQDSKYSEKGFYKVEGKLAGLNDTWISDVKLPVGTHEVQISVTKYQGKFNLRIVGPVGK